MTIPKTMQAVVYRGPNDLRLETVPVPKIRAGELLVRVAVCGVCPTDIKKIQYGTVPPPRIFGHETAGVIAQVGAGVKNFRVGDRVALHHHIPCLKCHLCRHRAYAQCPGYKRTGITAGFEPAGGGYAEYVRVMSFVLPGVVKIPARNTFVEGAMLEPVNTVLKAIQRLDLLTGDTALVIGQGPIGLLFTRLLEIRGIKVIATDLMPSRLKLARKWGATLAFNAADPKLLSNLRRAIQRQSEIRNPKSEIGFDAATLAVPSQTAISQAFEAVRGSGKILLFAHTRRNEPSQVDLSKICVDEKDLIGSYSADVTLQNEVARLIFSRKLDVRPLVTHQFPLAKAADAVALAAKPTGESLKVVVNQEIEG